MWDGKNLLLSAVIVWFGCNGSFRTFPVTHSPSSASQKRMAYYLPSPGPHPEFSDERKQRERVHRSHTMQGMQVQKFSENRLSSRNIVLIRLTRTSLTRTIPRHDSWQIDRTLWRETCQLCGNCSAWDSNRSGSDAGHINGRSDKTLTTLTVTKASSLTFAAEQDPRKLPEGLFIS